MMPPSFDRPLRVIQWTTGNIGRTSLHGGVFGYHRGWIGDRNVVSVGFNWTMGQHVTPPKPLAHRHVVQVFGRPNYRTVLHCLPPITGRHYP